MLLQDQKLRQQLATKPGGLMPKYPATNTAKKDETRAISNSFFCDMSGIRIFLIRSLETEVDITSNRPAAVDRAAAKPPAATRAMIHAGKFAISGLAKTIMSLSIINSFSFELL